MKIWEKNYVLTMILLLLLLYGSIFFMEQYSFRENLEKYCENSYQNEIRAEYAVSMFLMGGEYQRLEWYCRSLERQSIYLQVRDGEEILTDHLPFSWENCKEKAFQIVRNQSRIYACISKSMDYENIYIFYLEDISGLYEIQRKQMFILLSFAVLISLSLSGILYHVMKKIYAPVNNIAHELRTPLTAIQGYSQYIMFGNIGKEDVDFACREIESQAEYMNALIENLLIMGNLRDGEIRMKNIESDFIIKEMQQYFPFLSFDKQTEYLYGDKTLLVSLLRNIISNTARQGENIRVTIGDNVITVCNGDDFIEEEMLEVLNSSHAVPREKVEGKGLGVSLCREIVKKHHGKLIYQRAENGGVEILILLWQT